jgi:hypothetical protein
MTTKNRETAMNEVQQAPGDWVDHVGTPVRWIDDDAPVASAMASWGPAVPRGWHPLLRQTLVKLRAVSGSIRRDVALAAMQLVSGGDTLGLRIEIDDAVLRGIVRKAADRSLEICQVCARAGRRRELAGGRAEVLCPRCAAPRLLRCHVDELLQTAPFLIRISVPVSQAQVPDLLRRDFRAAAAAHPTVETADPARMSPARFEDWVRSWRRACAAWPAESAPLHESHQ